LRDFDNGAVESRARAVYVRDHADVDVVVLASVDGS
jgi:hypothetical protein